MTPITAMFAAAALLSSLAAHAQQKEQYTYRCTGKDGKKYYGQTIPPPCLGQPMELINKQGLVVKRIDPEVSADDAMVVSVFRAVHTHDTQTFGGHRVRRRHQSRVTECAEILRREKGEAGHSPERAFAVPSRICCAQCLGRVFDYDDPAMSRFLRQALDVNVIGAFNCARSAVGPMMAQGNGNIINVTSGAHLGLPEHGNYGASKGAVASFTYGWAVDLADKYRDPATFDRAATLAWTQAQVQLRHLGIDANEAHLFQDLASRILYSDAALRPSSAVLTGNSRGPAGLWRFGISGDLPIVLVRIDQAEDRDIVRQLLRAHEYWRMKQLAVDLVILNEQAPSYAQDLQDLLESQLRASQSRLQHDGHEPSGSVFILRGDLISVEDRTLLQTAARAVLLSRRGTLAEQVERQQRSQQTPVLALQRRPPATKALAALPARPELEFFNGLGGFTADGREYVTILGEGQWTPAPWINVIANPSFGFQVSESGSGYTWSLNSRENQLTPWSNDPVTDPPGEVIYVQDEDTGEMWGPTVLPIREEAWSYTARHGQGYSRFENTSHGVSLDLLQFVPLAEPIKISRLTIENHSGRSRRLSVTAYVEWVLGASRSASAPFIITEVDPETGMMLARNAWNSEFSGRIAFADLGARQTAWTGDRTEFIGRNGTLDHPLSLEREDQLSGKVGAGFDPCCAMQTTVELGAGERTEIVFFLGETVTTEEARALIERYRSGLHYYVFPGGGMCESE